MTITLLENDKLGELLNFVYKTIRASYQVYYPSEVVDFFVSYHSPEAVMKDISAGLVYVVENNGAIAATVSVKGYNINRMFVDQKVQGTGLGTGLMSFAEALIAKEHEFAQLAASIPGYPFYFRRGYRTEYCGETAVENGKKLVYQVMRRRLA